MAVAAAPALGSELVSISAQPAHLTFNKFVITGYRPHPLSPSQAVLSAFTLHNETFSIHSHLLGALVCIFFATSDWARVSLSHSHWAAVAVADLSSAVCFLFSVAYHTLMPVPLDARGYARLMSLDVWGIWVVNTGAALVLSHNLFVCGPGWVGAALVLGPALGAAAWILFFARTPASRAAAFGICWLFRVATIALTAAFGLAPWTAQGAAVHLFCELFPAAGAVINVLRVPEKWRPGRFDLLGQSHHIMHVFVAVGMISQHYLGAARAAAIDSDPRLLACAQDPATVYARGFAWLWEGALGHRE
jgi:adiponectin receptor